MDNKDIFSLVSLVFYSIVYLPQFSLIYKNKSSHGISIWMLIMWTQADALSLFGTILLYLPISFLAMALYHFLVGTLLICFVLFYNYKNNKNNDENNDINKENKYKRFEIYYSIGFMIINILIGIILITCIKTPNNTIGGFISWITMCLYIIGRFPQIYDNWNTRTTEGLSLLMYIFTMLGNLFYIAVIYFSPEYLIENIPWLISSIISILLDIVIIIQHYYYKNLNDNNKNKHGNYKLLEES